MISQDKLVAHDPDLQGSPTIPLLQYKTIPLASTAPAPLKQLLPEPDEETVLPVILPPFELFELEEQEPKEHDPEEH